VTCVPDELRHCLLAAAAGQNCQTSGISAAAAAIHAHAPTRHFNIFALAAGAAVFVVEGGGESEDSGGGGNEVVLHGTHIGCSRSRSWIMIV
jgi:hypothetical protein